MSWREPFLALSRTAVKVFRTARVIKPAEKILYTDPEFMLEYIPL